MISQIKPYILLTLSCMSLPVFCTSLFHQAPYHSFIADKKAANEGDVLTVLIIETANAQTKSGVSSDKSLSTGLGGVFSHQSLESSLNLKGDGRINAQTERTGAIKATVTVHIKTAFDNGFYYLQGTQHISINGEEQTIRVEGMVRAEDINADNTVLSTRLANARIIYKGQGIVSNAHTHHYFYNALSSIGLV